MFIQYCPICRRSYFILFGRQCNCYINPDGQKILKKWEQEDYQKEAQEEFRRGMQETRDRMRKYREDHGG